jgi:hypothetical protein
MTTSTTIMVMTMMMAMMMSRARQLVSARQLNHSEAKRRKMFPTRKTIWTGAVLTFLTIGVLGLSQAPLAFADQPKSEDIKQVQKTLRDKGYNPGEVDGKLGPRTRAAIRQYQQSETLPVTGRLDDKTAGKLGVGPESIGESFEGAGHEVGQGSVEGVHEIKKGKVIAAGKEMGKGIGRAGKKVGLGVKNAVSPKSDRGDREKKQEAEETKAPK